MLNPIQEDRMSSVALEDVNNNITTSLNQQSSTTNMDLPLPLKSVLKVHRDYANEHDIMVVAFKVCAMFVVIFNFPIVVADLYFAFTDTTCIDETPKGLFLSLRNYLMVSGFMGLWSIVCAVMMTFVKDITIFTVWSIRLVGVFITLFCLTWNILGGVVFWGTHGNCDVELSTYMYISLIVKIVANMYMISLK